MLGLTLRSKLDMGSYIISTPKNLQEIESLIHSMKFLSPDVALYLYKSTTWSCMEYCYHVWAGSSSCYLELFDKLQKRICGVVGPSLAASLQPLDHCRHLASLSLFYRQFVDIHLNWLKWFLFLIPKLSLFVTLIDCMIFCHHPQKLEGCLCQQFLSLNSQTLEISAYKTLPFVL